MHIRWGLFALSILALPVPAEIYSWKDAAGQVHFGDQPPAGQAKEIVRPRINTIETFEPDQKLYEEIQIVRLSASRDTDSSDKPLHLVLVEPATHVDYQSGVFDIEVQFVDKNGKVWKTFAHPAPSRTVVGW